MDWFLVFRRAMTLAVLFVIAGPAAAAEKRVALVIGNAAYAHATALKTPANDTELVAKTLHEIGFTDVLEQYNLGMAAMSTALETFGMRAEGADWAVIYYAGHGLELAGDGFPQARFARGLCLSGWRQGTAEVTVIGDHQASVMESGDAPSSAVLTVGCGSGVRSLVLWRNEHDCSSAVKARNKGGKTKNKQSDRSDSVRRLPDKVRKPARVCQH
jgi:hypothetical protein